MPAFPEYYTWLLALGAVLLTTLSFLVDRVGSRSLHSHELDQINAQHPSDHNRDECIKRISELTTAIDKVKREASKNLRHLTKKFTDAVEGVKKEKLETDKTVDDKMIELSYTLEEIKTDASEWSLELRRKITELSEGGEMSGSEEEGYDAQENQGEEEERIMVNVYPGGVASSLPRFPLRQSGYDAPYLTPGFFPYPRDPPSDAHRIARFSAAAGNQFRQSPNGSNYNNRDPEFESIQEHDFRESFSISRGPAME
ncbi:hypothetical protein P280DRAFT_512855 [Massarina eburnea CBS 473.64]|uniref:Uncharacterized protein n=1 Tax=Massarina eburnea CBS 473.64 TaxID=1395130 RepID=A0A6A6SG03_9PLEO|nr:hypothetical protein P280DRAFT_512855 [Massarina eburnea CBS 473.64]